MPQADSATGTSTCGNRSIGGIEISWLDGYLQSTVIPALASRGVNPTNVPIFLMHNVIEYIGTPSDCCDMGYHSAVSTSAGIQTYAVAEYDNDGGFPGISDISALTHEVAGWQNNPYATNPTPQWARTSPQPACVAGLEVGDPLTGTTFSDTVAGFTYHPQELAFFSWFYDQSPSLGVHGWYSDQGTFTTFSSPCS